MNALNRNMISLPKFHSFIVWFKDICLDLMFAVILPGSSRDHLQHVQARQIPGMEWPACSPDLNPIELLWNQLGKAIRSIQSAGPTTNPPWTMGCNPTDQDHQTDPQHEEKVPSYHRGIWGDKHGIDKHVSLWLSIDLQNEKPGVALRFLGTFHYRPPPCSQTHSGGYNNQKITFVISIDSWMAILSIDKKYMAPMTNL